MLTGTLTVDGKPTPISQGRINGEAISFVAGGQPITGRVSGNTIEFAKGPGPVLGPATRWRTRRHMNTLSIALCISIGSCVAWLIALYRPDGTSSLLWNFPLGMAGAALSALAIAWLAPWLGIAGLVILDPFGACSQSWPARDPSPAPYSSGSVVKNSG